MSHHETGIGHHNQDNQMATDHDHQSGNKPPSHSISNPVASDACLSAEHSEAAEKTRDECATAKVQQIYRHAEALRLHGRVHPSISVFESALRGFTRHVDKSIPWSLRASRAILPRFWFSVHHKAAVSALHQVHRQVHQLGLTRVEDTKGFLQKHCRWYGLFCSFSQVVTSLFSPPHKEMI